MGGGCVLDYAKIVQFSLSSNLEKIINSDLEKKIRVKLKLAIPITAGSELSPHQCSNLHQ